MTAQGATIGESGQLRGAEVLVRWRKPDGTLVLPGAFIPLMESSDLIDDLTRHLMRNVCIEVGPALGRRPDLQISFNLAGKLFSEPSIDSDVRTIFANSGPQVFTGRLGSHRARSHRELHRNPADHCGPARAGVRIAIDDVGTGHSWLSYMLKLGVDIIKIDKMFVDAIGTDRNSTTIVETLVDLARNMRNGCGGRGRRELRAGDASTGARCTFSAGLCLRATFAGVFLQLVEAIDPLQPAGSESHPVGFGRADRAFRIKGTANPL